MTEIGVAVTRLHHHHRVETADRDDNLIAHRITGDINPSSIDTHPHANPAQQYDEGYTDGGNFAFSDVNAFDGAGYAHYAQHPPSTQQLPLQPLHQPKSSTTSSTTHIPTSIQLSSYPTSATSLPLLLPTTATPPGRSPPYYFSTFCRCVTAVGASIAMHGAFLVARRVSFSAW